MAKVSLKKTSADWKDSTIAESVEDAAEAETGREGKLDGDRKLQNRLTSETTNLEEKFTKQGFNVFDLKRWSEVCVRQGQINGFKVIVDMID